MNKKILEASKEEISGVIKQGCYKVISEKRKNNLYYGDIDLSSGEITPHTTYTLKSAVLDDLALEYRLYDSRRKRKERVKGRITDMVNTNKALFLTLTFSDNMFSRGCSGDTRKRYVRRFLKSECKQYLANLDFGTKNKREHYHAVVVPKTKINFDKYREFFDSNINCKRIINNESSKKLVSRYIAKLTNHALKENGFYQRLIFSRNNS